MNAFKHINEDELIEWVADTEKRINSLEGQLAHSQRLLEKLTQQVQELVDVGIMNHQYS